MTIPQSKVTADGQVSVPPENQKTGRYTFDDIHRALFPTPPKPRTIEEMDEGIRRHLRAKHARR
jgi:hypothetical protein